MDTKFIKNVVKYIVTAILSILVIAYFIYHLFNGFSTKIETEAAFLTTKRETISLDAYILREETVLYSNSGGGVNYLYEDGEKVSKDSKIADIYSSAGGSGLTEKIIDIDRKINVLEKSNSDKNISSSDTQAIDKKINELFYVMRDKIETGNIEYALRKRDELLTLLNRRLVLVQAVGGYEDKIVLLQGERTNLTTSMNDISETIYAKDSGYFYTMVDGYEDIFTVNNAQNMTLALFDEIISSPPKENTGDAIGKLVTNYNWYVVCEITKEQNRSFTENGSYDIVFPYSASEELNMTLERIIAPTDSDRVLLVFKTNVMPNGFNYLRKQEIEVVQSSYTGYKIPISSVRMVNGVQGVYILSGNIVTFKEITPLLEQNGYYIVKEQPTYLEDDEYYKKIGLYDLVITKGTGLYDGKIVDS